MGELARKPGAPKYSETPLELLTPRPGEGFSLFDKYVYPVTATILGLGTVGTYNSWRRRPLWAGIHNYFIVTTICVSASFFLRDSRLAARAEKDAVLKHYISLHPEDFPPFERKRLKDVFLPWHPAR